MTLLDRASLAHLDRALARLEEGFATLPPVAAGEDPRLGAILDEVALRLRDNYPYFHPLYAGQMLKPPHPVARLAYALAHVDQPEQPRARRRAAPAPRWRRKPSPRSPPCSAGAPTSAT